MSVYSRAHPRKEVYVIINQLISKLRLKEFLSETAITRPSRKVATRLTARTIILSTQVHSEQGMGTIGLPGIPAYHTP
jgi:hypothetical protein